MIDSVRGNISGAVPHGVYTNISSTSGNVDTMIWAYGTTSPKAASEIYTISNAGDTYVTVYGLPRELPEEYYNPLLNTVSSHEVGEGDLWVSYPFSWRGDMEGEVEHGNLTLEARWLDYVKQSEGYVEARRGRKGGSHMGAHVATGSMIVQLGIYGR
jgi:hypothetical protein